MHSHFRGHEFDPSWGTKILYAMQCSKKRKIKKLNSNKTPGSHWHDLLSSVSRHIWLFITDLDSAGKNISIITESSTDGAAIDEKSVTVNILLACVYQALTAC